MITSSAAIFFASPSAIGVAGDFIALYQGSIGVIGQTTRSNLERHGYIADFVADMGSDEPLIDQLSNWLSALTG